MKQTILKLLFICLVTTALSCGTKSKNDHQLVVLSYNIHHGEGMDKELDLARIAKVITSVSPDLVSLQEVDNQTGRSFGVNQAQELARLTGMRAIFGASMDFNKGQYGNAILSRLTIDEILPLSLPGEPRSALCAVVEKTLEDSSVIRFSFIATHLDTKAEPRLQSVPMIEDYFSADSTEPAILAGDLNAVPGSPTMQELHKTWKNATADQSFFTYPVVNPEKQIDYILFRPADRWRVIETRVLDESMASDHRPIVATLEWLPDAATGTHP